ncbi:12588_t:CDS:2, partial [Racocetra persica]
MVRGHNLSIDTVAASRAQKVTSNENHSSFDDDDYLTSSPSTIEEEIDFSLVYALHTFHATVEGQANVVKGDSLSLLDDSNSYWWLVKVLPTDEIGYIPAENIE